MTTRSLNKLDPKKVGTLPDGSHSDGGNLYLNVRDDGRLRSWLFRYTVAGRTRELGLGALKAISLKDARVKRDELRRLIDEGRDPLAERAKNRAEQAAKKTFREIAQAVLDRKTGGWKGGKGSTSIGAWTRSLMVVAKPLHLIPVDEITTADVKRVVAPKWDGKQHVEARLLLNRIGEVLDYATAHGLRTGDNPASWSIFKHIAPDVPKVKKHHPALEWRDAPAFIERLRSIDTVASLALEFLILTGTRLNETCKAEWSEIGRNRALWTIGESRMKKGQEHAVPLSGRAMAIVTALYEHRGPSRYVFPGRNRGQPITDGAVKELCRKLTDGAACPHGFRATFRSWCSDYGVPFEVAENALAHSKQGVVASYDRSTMIERRRPVMQAWADYLYGKVTEPTSAEDNVVQMPMREVA
jgi:integrase